ncbi:unnamed protein product [Scytosiphon promiscuus]
MGRGGGREAAAEAAPGEGGSGYNGEYMGSSTPRTRRALQWRQDSRGPAESAGGSLSPRARGLPHSESAGSYEVYMNYDRHLQAERGMGPGSSRRWGSSSNMAPVSSGRSIVLARCGSSYISSSLRGRSANGNGGSAPNRTGRYSFGSAGSMGFFGGGSEGNVGGASGRAPPRAVVLEGVRTGSGNVSNRFYPDPDSEDDDQQGPRGSVGVGDLATAGMEFTPLSPDAFSGFTKDHRDDRRDRNQEVHDATSNMVEVAIPTVAEFLLDHHEEPLDLAVELHRHGVNVRHLGKVRSCILEREDDRDKNRVVLDAMLTEMIARTLKNILRSFQRMWMKEERSTSEHGMRMLVVEFLNLVTGAHPNSRKFWQEKVLVGVLQRFGLAALQVAEKNDIWQYCISERPYVLKVCVARLTEMQGVVLIPVAQEHFSQETCPIGFEFNVADIQEIRPIVRYMHILDYGGGVMLSMQAERLEQDRADPRIVKRLKCMAKQCFITAYQSLPDDLDTRSAIVHYTASEDYGTSPPASPPAFQLAAPVDVSSPGVDSSHDRDDVVRTSGDGKGCIRRAMAWVRSLFSVRRQTWVPCSAGNATGTPQALPDPVRRLSSSGGVSDGTGGASVDTSEVQ